MIVGAFTVTGIGLLVWSIFFFKPSAGDGKQRLTVKFANIENIDIGTRVTYAGKPCGEVIAINQIIESRENVLDDSGQPYSYSVVLALDSGIRVYNTDLIEIHTSGLLGEKSIAIIPQPFLPGEKPVSVIGHTIYARSADPLASTLKSVSKASDSIADTMTHLSEILEQNQKGVSSSVNNLNQSLEQIRGIVLQINQSDLVGTMQRAASGIADFTTQAGEMMKTMQGNGLLEKIGQAADRFNTVMGQLSEGKGTLGKLINDPTLYLEAVGMMERVNQLVYDLNHYGLLFHRNRQWKQKQAQRLAEVEALNSPDAFKKTFEEEMTRINQALDKVSELIEQADAGDEEIIDGKEFKKYFYDLLLEVYRLQNLIQLYNEKLNLPS